MLALGFVGLDYPEEAADLFETAILAQGEVAESLNFKPSFYEDVLGRDYLFGLRCLGDDIPCNIRVLRQMITRLADEILYVTGSSRFRRYSAVLSMRQAQLIGSKAVMVLTPYSL